MFEGDTHCYSNAQVRSALAPLPVIAKGGNRSYIELARFKI